MDGNGNGSTRELYGAPKKYKIQKKFSRLSNSFRRLYYIMYEYICICMYILDLTILYVHAIQPYTLFISQQHGTQHCPFSLPFII